ncbi:homocysteine S-methyltransferase family protein [Vibrio barjaei]|uniref:homocysteine S-methyltransferase family protein n=1 Tax=Vibrio barjaei TaxID=1676683 RepID=UPI0007BAEE79|nr:homocysteine S-methyltransferase family protein [Vibrio barjaei]OIN27827.1 homocysteine methyltransferase [Vibrio barjaei]
MNPLIILDGGMGRELKRMGAPFSQPYWSAQALIEAPHFVEKAHQQFIDAGADIITTNSYACVPFHLGDLLYQERGTELASLAAKLAKNAVSHSNRAVTIAGSLPPAFGSYRPDLFMAEQGAQVWQDLMQAQDAYVDIWLVETLSSIEEAQVVSQVLAESTKPKYYAYTLLDDVSQLGKLRSGETVVDAVQSLLKHNPDGILFNCSIPEVIEAALAATAKVLESHHSSICLGAFANSFTPIQSGHKANDAVQELRDVCPQEYLQFAKKWQQHGANVIGGCCGIGPEHIEVLAKWKASVK